MANNRVDLILFVVFLVGCLVALVGVGLYDYRLSLVLGGLGMAAFALTVDVEV